MPSGEKTPIIHGHSRSGNGGWGTRTYVSWMAMRARCNNKNDPRFSDYGGRGITVCARWNYSFLNFLSDMGERPNGKSLDRINNNGNYEPENCRWATRQEQQRNLRNNRYFIFRGRRLLTQEIAEQTGVPSELLWNRLARGWSAERAVTTKKLRGIEIPYRKTDNVLEHNGKKQCIAAWSRELGLAEQTIGDRLRRGWPLSKVFLPADKRFNRFKNNTPKTKTHLKKK